MPLQTQTDIRSNISNLVAPVLTVFDGNKPCIPYFIRLESSLKPSKMAATADEYNLAIFNVVFIYWLAGFRAGCT